jgi:hypothetical protein
VVKGADESWALELLLGLVSRQGYSEAQATFHLSWTQCPSPRRWFIPQPCGEHLWCLGGLVVQGRSQDCTGQRFQASEPLCPDYPAASFKSKCKGSHQTLCLDLMAVGLTLQLATRRRPSPDSPAARTPWLMRQVLGRHFVLGKVQQYWILTETDQ